MAKCPSGVVCAGKHVGKVGPELLCDLVVEVGRDVKNEDREAVRGGAEGGDRRDADAACLEQSDSWTKQRGASGEQQVQGHLRVGSIARP